MVMAHISTMVAAMALNIGELNIWMPTNAYVQKNII